MKATISMDIHVPQCVDHKSLQNEAWNNSSSTIFRNYYLTLKKQINVRDSWNVFVSVAHMKTHHVPSTVNIMNIKNTTVHEKKAAQTMKKLTNFQVQTSYNLEMLSVSLVCIKAVGTNNTV